MDLYPDNYSNTDSDNDNLSIFSGSADFIDYSSDEPDTPSTVGVFSPINQQLTAYRITTATKDHAIQTCKNFYGKWSGLYFLFLAYYEEAKITKQPHIHMVIGWAEKPPKSSMSDYLHKTEKVAYWSKTVKDNTKMIKYTIKDGYQLACYGVSREQIAHYIVLDNIVKREMKQSAREKCFEILKKYVDDNEFECRRFKDEKIYSKHEFCLAELSRVLNKHYIEVWDKDTKPFLIRGYVEYCAHKMGICLIELEQCAWNYWRATN